MNIGDLVSDEWGDLAIITSQVGVLDRFRIKYIFRGGIASAWSSNLYPLAPSETQKKVSKKT